MYTLEDYENAKLNLLNLNEKWDNYMGNNPNKYQSEIKKAHLNLKKIEEYLKYNNILKRNDEEELNFQLDKLYPNAKSKLIVEYNGKNYKKIYKPYQLSRSKKTVREWESYWEEV